jgi:5-methylcytosine-specific restriction enzyme A
VPVMPQSGCLVPRCPNRATHRGRCQEHYRELERGRRRQSNHSRLHGSTRWQQARATFLAQPENRWCRYCQAKGTQTPAECIDHSTASKGDARVFWDRSRWVPSCLPCNTKKGIRSEGAFGRPTSASTHERGRG